MKTFRIFLFLIFLSWIKSFFSCAFRIAEEQKAKDRKLQDSCLEHAAIFFLFSSNKNLFSFEIFNFSFEFASYCSEVHKRWAGNDDNFYVCFSIWRFCSRSWNLMEKITFLTFHFFFLALPKASLKFTLKSISTFSLFVS